ncbi:hypothetical protein Tco_1268479 [Tanacetum coccineum]
MATTDKESSAAGTDNHPPMLEESDFVSWKIHIESQGLPRYIFNILNQIETEKEILENVELLMQGSSLTEQQKKETLFDQYERSLKWKSQFIRGIPSLSITYLRIEYAPAPQQVPQSTNDAMLVMMNQIVNLLSGFQKQFPPTNNQLKTSTNPKTQATIQAGRITTESVQRRAPDKALLIETKEKGDILDAEAKAFLADVECTSPFVEPLAITTTTAFEVSHEDAYDSDFDEAPHAAAAFMANLMQTGPSTGQGTSNVNDFHSEVQTYDNHFFDNMHLHVS